MKKIISIILCLSIVLVTCFTLSSFSADEIYVEFDGTQMSFDVNPQVINGRTMLPMRAVFEKIGALVKWDSDTQTISARKGSKTVNLAIGSDTLTIDKGKTDDDGNPVLQTVTLDAAAQIISDRTLVPVRAVCESFNLNVDWDEKNRKVIITSETEDDSWKENTGSINLSDLTFSGNGIEIKNNQILITDGGDFTLTGTLADGNITISSSEKVKLRLSGVSITSSEGACIFVENADKAYITVTEDTKNTLVCQTGEDGAIYSKDNLEIKGKGSLEITSAAGHAIKASDNLTIENSNITVDAKKDGFHVNDTFKMTGGNVKITAKGDGIDSQSIVIISGGTLDISTTQTPVSQTSSEDEVNQNNRHGFMPEQNTDVEFETSSKGITSEWMSVISGGEITINSASHALHCKDEIEISGGSLTLNSEYEKGVSAHGNLTISGSDTYIDIKKSTEGLESKKTLTINDGTIKIVASDDGINATGGKSGDMPGGQMMTQGHGKRNDFNNDSENPDANKQPIKPEEQKNRPDMTPPQPNENAPMPDFDKDFMPEKGFEKNPEDFEKNPDFENGDTPPDAPFGENSGISPNGNTESECLIINGGNIEIFAKDDCLDSNGSLTLNGGTIKAFKENGSFTGPNSILDADGKVTINDSVTLIAAGSGGTQGSLNISQNYITIYSEQTLTSQDNIIIKDENGNTIAEYTPNGNYSAVLITSPKIEIGKTYTVSLGATTHTVSVNSQSTSVGTQKTNRFDRPAR